MNKVGTALTLVFYNKKASRMWRVPQLIYQNESICIREVKKSKNHTPSTRDGSFNTPSTSRYNKWFKYYKHVSFSRASVIFSLLMCYKYTPLGVYLQFTLYFRCLYAFQYNLSFWWHCFLCRCDSGKTRFYR